LTSSVNSDICAAVAVFAIGDVSCSSTASLCNAAAAVRLLGKVFPPFRVLFSTLDGKEEEEEEEEGRLLLQSAVLPSFLPFDRKSSFCGESEPGLPHEGHKHQAIFEIVREERVELLFNQTQF
jgi:hypothetical protein